MNPRIFWLCLPLLTQCKPSQGPAGEAPAPPPPAPVTVAHPKKEKITEWNEFTGRLAASEEVRIYAQVTGYLESVHFTEGTFVKKDQLLFRIDPKPFLAVRDQAAAQVEQVKVRHELAENELKRANRLVQANAISLEEHDNKSKAVREAAAAMKVAEAALNKAELDVQYCSIKAPMDGRIGLRRLDPGALVVGGPMGATELAGMLKLDPIYAYIDVDERSIQEYNELLQAGKAPEQNPDGTVPCEMALADNPNFAFKGGITMASDALDASTGTIQLRCVFPNPMPKTGLQLLQAGYFCRVRTAKGLPYEALLVPDTAVGADQASKVVMLVGENNIVTPRVVETGPVINGMRVIRSGLAETDLVIINGLSHAYPGVPVAPEMETAEKQPAPAEEPQQSASDTSKPAADS